MVLVADCLPVALAGEGEVAMLHCGWRGLAAGILRRGREALGSSAVAAAVGPGIGSCCYEVSADVLRVFDETDRRERARLDLRAIARAQLAELDVEVEVDVDLCTSCHPDLFYSHRRDGEHTGRQAGIAWLP
jgi:copper oxidase (laccase) domain-containing protein